MTVQSKHKLSKLIQWLLTGEIQESNINPTDSENYEFRRLMRDQLKQLKDKGVPIRIMTL